MNLVVNGDVVERPLTDELIEQSILSLSGDSDSFVILSTDEMTYLQTSGNPESGFILEYQEGSLADHYTCTTPDLSAGQIVKTFKRYFIGDTRWKADLRWEREDLGGLHIGPWINKLVMFLGIALVAWISWRILGKGL